MQPNHAPQLRIHTPHWQDDPFRGYPPRFVELGHNILRQYESGEYRLACVEARIALESAIQEYFRVRMWFNGGDLNALLEDSRLRRVLRTNGRLPGAMHCIRNSGNSAAHPPRKEKGNHYFHEVWVRALINYVLLAYDALLKRDRPTGSCWSVVK